jgi:Ricin-type beta-trefoil lectin domain
MNVANPIAGQTLTLAACGSSSKWIPTASIGPGAAALPQWINYQEFGRCLDITSAIITNTLIDYPCKQNPFPGAVKWNQLFQAPIVPTGQSSVTGTMSTTTTPGGSPYCLTSPGTDGGYVTMTSCSTGTSSQQWTIYGGDKSLPYSTKYEIVNGSLCLGLLPLASGATWSSIDVETCNGTSEQKWNGTANVLNSTVKNTKEK